MAKEIKCYLENKSSEAKVLDWGCGYGHMTFFMSRLDLKAIPCDIQQESLSFYRKMNMGNFIVIPSIYLPFRDESFDGVLSCGALEHVIDKQKSLSELWRVIKKNGYLFIYMLPHKYGLFEFINTLLKKNAHPVKYTSMSIKQILKTQGFEIIEIKKSNLFPKNIPLFLPLFLRKIIKKIYNKNYSFLISTEKFLLKMPISNIFAGTIEIIARKI